MTSQLDALIFDVDGTLAETEEAHRDAFNRAFQEAGESWHWDRALYGRLLKVGGGKERLHHFLEQFHPERLVDAVAADRMIRALHARKTELYGELVGELDLRPGIGRLIAEARSAGLKLAMATTTSRVNVEGLLRNSPEGVSLDLFDAVATGEDAPVKKPDPMVYHAALDGLGLPPERCMALEDAVIGVKAAGNAGVPVLVTESAYTEGEDFSGAVAVLSDLGTETAPFTQRDGTPAAQGVVDLAMLRRWHAEAVA
mgnify:CR=1 FL=1